jgi:hypothetical protein
LHQDSGGQEASAAVREPATPRQTAEGEPAEEIIESPRSKKARLAEVRKSKAKEAKEAKEAARQAAIAAGLEDPQKKAIEQKNQIAKARVQLNRYQACTLQAQHIIDACSDSETSAWNWAKDPMGPGVMSLRWILISSVSTVAVCRTRLDAV